MIVGLFGAAAARAQDPAVDVLVFHGSGATADAGVAAIEDLGADNDFGVTATDDPADFTGANLDGYRAVVFLDAGGDRLTAAQEAALQGFISDGGGFIGIGAAAEAQPDSNYFDDLIGARPDEEESVDTVREMTVAVGDRVHPATEGLPLEWDREDSWYVWEDRPTGEVHTLARYHETGAPAGDGTDTGGTDHPISWCRDFGGGRSFYTGMGRTAGSYGQASFQDHLLGAIQWSAGMIRGGCKATISSNYEGERITDASSPDLAHTAEPHGVVTADNGWVIYIGRADCRNNTERGKMIGAGPTPRITNFANPNVGVGCGPVHIWDPEAANGTVNSGVTKAAVLPVYGDRGGGSEINGKIEAGLLGIALAEDFTETGHVYLQYFPTFNPDNPVHPGLEDGLERRISKIAKPRISRFTIDLETKQMDLDSEVVIFEYDSQIWSCCHRGGGMGFDSEGNLYVTTGDSNSSQQTGGEGGNGYSGNNQIARCPTAAQVGQDPNVPSNDHCGTNGISYQDARRTAGSTNDYNGKMLRFNPLEDIEPGAEPGPGSTYSLPTADSPNGPNLFSGDEGTGDQAKPEIYAMGLRNPSRLSIDPETDIPYSAWVGPDAGSPSATLGPSTYESASQIDRAGNYGWPYCMGNGQAYRDRMPNGSLRTVNQEGYVNGGPAGAPTAGWYDCANIHNDSVNNTGLVELPHETGTGMDAGAMRPHNIWYSRGNPGGNNGCPVYPRPLGAGNAPNYGAVDNPQTQNVNEGPSQLCPYVIGAGATVFNGPVYRYEEGEDNSERWPEYWDGRWFLHDAGNTSVKHGLLLDPETDQDGGQPVYADSLRGVLNWQASYMDSKFGPDGAYYVQVYQGFFDTGSQAGLYRFTYTGGPDTPNPDPQWTAGGGETRFTLGSSGGVSYEWDFGDGSATTTEAEPTHTYAEPGTYTASLTVTYADGEELTETTEVLVSDDTAVPTTSIQIDGAAPAPQYDRRVEVTLSATDGTGGNGVEWTEYRIDGGAWERSENGDDVDPFVTTFNVGGNGDHTVEYRSRDGAGNVSEIESVAFRIQPAGGGASCLPQSDEFEGTALDAKWDVLRPEGSGPQVADGALSLELLQGDFIANDPLAKNVVLQDAPNGEWTVTTKLDPSTIDANGEQAGIVVWQSENPNTFSKIVAIQPNSGIDQFEHIVTTDGDVDPPIPSSITPAPGGELPEETLLRARYDGEQVIAEFSADGGVNWTRIGQPDHSATTFEGPLRVGLTAFRGGSGGGSAEFDWFRVQAGAADDAPVECGGAGCDPLSDQFDGDAIDAKWELLNESTNPDTRPSAGEGHLNLPLVSGDYYEGNSGAQTLVQQAPTGSWVATAKIAHANVDTNGEAAGLVLINSLEPNHFLKTALQYKSDTDPDTPGDQNGKWAERVLTADGDAVTLPPATVPWPNSGALDPAGDYVYVRFVHDAEAGTVTTWTSTDGTTFSSFGADISVEEYLSQPGGLRLGLFGKHDGSGDDEVQVDAFNVVSGTADPQTPGDDCGEGLGQCPQTDDFEGDELDEKWEIRNANPGALSVGDGNLTLTTAQGDVRGGSFTAQNIVLQDVPEGPWSATVKFDHTAINSNGQAAGMVVYGQENPNYFAKVATQFKNNDLSGNPMNGIWTERTLTSNGGPNRDYGGEFPNTGKLEPPTDDLWTRVSYDGTNVITEYSYDGETFTAIAPPVPADQYGPNGVTKVGLFVKHDGGGPETDVNFDSFTVEADSCGTGGDASAPRTTHALDPAEPNGDAGWYTSPVEVSLSATDNEGGSGVATTEYRMAGEEEWTTYEGPFTLDGEGDHEVEYRSIDEAGNTENVRSVSFRIDTTAPTTTALLNGEEPESNYDGPVEVDLNADDGDGSGVRATEVRIDGGEWQPYAEEEVLLNSADDLEAWEQAGPGGLNWVAEDGGFARTFGGLGMPWYPKEYGDFSLKLQWRDSSTGTNGNGGLFARFPHPEETVDRPAAERYPCQVGSATSSPAWVAIYCGHEIQINDHQGDVQKTGSIYNFAPLNATQAKIQPRGTWVDYELRVVGQTYTIIRNGEVLQEWENAPDQESSRAGDPSTSDRQFARGYIGLQNHGNADVIDYRNIRIQSLDEGSVQGPFTIEGDGEHTVEYRSTDNAGNVEDVKSTTFTIGDDPGGDDQTPPETTHSLDPENPGAGGTYDGPVDITLSATDPEEDGEPQEPTDPETHQVRALNSTWDPDQVDATVGDTVQWNFPTAEEVPGATIHDLWLARPGDDPETERFQVGDGYAMPGAPPRTYEVDEAGAWTYICTIHAAMRGTIDVAEGGGGEPVPGSGVATTEYRLNGGEWVESENTEGDDPFETTFTVSDEGDHEVEYRSTDNAGNVEETKSVAFSIEDEQTDPEAPTVEGFADPSTGAAPLLVQFSAAGLDPQGGDLTYAWDFGDGGGAIAQSPTHTYTEEGTYTATVTVTDEQGKTGSATVEIVVTADGNEAPVIVAAAADPGSGVAPLEVQFSADARDPDGEGEDAVTYLWDFGDGGANAFGPNAQHTYVTPGTYTATVTATDADGGFDVEELTIVVSNPPGNVAPTVQAAATPRSGTAPLRVQFTSVARDADGDRVSTVWDFGDGVKAGGANIAHTYRQPGTYTARVTVTDPKGATGTATVPITVRATTSGSGSSGTGGSTGSGGDVAGETANRAAVRTKRSNKVRTVKRRGLRLRISCTVDCRVKSVLRMSGQRIGQSKTIRIRADKTRTVVIRLNRNVRRNLLAAMRQAGVKRLKAQAVTTVRTADGKNTIRRNVRLTR